VTVDFEEMNARLEQAARIRATLRRASLEWRAFGRSVLEERERDTSGPHRSDDGHPRHRTGP
jgi:hypothetical protein